MLDPNNSNGLYNLGCALVRLGEHERAIDLLQEAIQGAPTRANLARQDSDLDAIRAHPRFIALINGAETTLSKEGPD